MIRRKRLSLAVLVLGIALVAILVAVPYGQGANPSPGGLNRVTDSPLETTQTLPDRAVGETSDRNAASRMSLEWSEAPFASVRVDLVCAATDVAIPGWIQVEGAAAIPTDDSGSVSLHIPSGVATMLRAWASGYGRQAKDVESPLESPVRFALKPAFERDIRVLRPDDTPASGARLRLAALRGGDLIVAAHTLGRTDIDGKWEGALPMQAWVQAFDSTGASPFECVRLGGAQGTSDQDAPLVLHLTQSVATVDIELPQGQDDVDGSFYLNHRAQSGTVSYSTSVPVSQLLVPSGAYHLALEDDEWQCVEDDMRSWMQLLSGEVVVQLERTARRTVSVIAPDGNPLDRGTDIWIAVALRGELGHLWQWRPPRERRVLDGGQVAWWVGPYPEGMRARIVAFCRDGRGETTASVDGRLDPPPVILRLARPVHLVLAAQERPTARTSERVDFVDKATGRRLLQWDMARTQEAELPYAGGPVVAVRASGLVAAQWESFDVERESGNLEVSWEWSGSISVVDAEPGVQLVAISPDGVELRGIRNSQGAWLWQDLNPGVYAVAPVGWTTSASRGVSVDVPEGSNVIVPARDSWSRTVLRGPLAVDGIPPEQLLAAAIYQEGMLAPGVMPWRPAVLRNAAEYELPRMLCDPLCVALAVGTDRGVRVLALGEAGQAIAVRCGRLTLSVPRLAAQDIALVTLGDRLQCNGVIAGGETMRVVGPGPHDLGFVPVHVTDLSISVLGRQETTSVRWQGYRATAVVEDPSRR